MSIVKTGNYTKFMDFKNSTILTFVADSEIDNYFKLQNMIKEKYGSHPAFQNCEEKEEYNNFNKVCFVQYDLYGNPMDLKLLTFDFENETITTENGRKYKVKKCNDYVYKVLKTQIKAINGIQGFYKYIVDTMHINDPLKSQTYATINRLDEQHEKAKTA